MSRLWDKLKEAKAVVEDMHGVFQYESQAGKGHVFTIRYPELDLYDIGQEASFSGPMRILVFDTYTPKGHIVEEATDSEAGLEIFRKEKIHLTIVDEHLPGASANGIETIHKIHEIDPQGCCVMTTKNEEDKASQTQAREIGVIAYYVKPLNIERIDFSITETKGFFKLREEVKKWSTINH